MSWRDYVWSCVCIVVTIVVCLTVAKEPHRQLDSLIGTQEQLLAQMTAMDKVETHLNDRILDLAHSVGHVDDTLAHQQSGFDTSLLTSIDPLAQRVDDLRADWEASLSDVSRQQVELSRRVRVLERTAHSP